MNPPAAAGSRCPTCGQLYPARAGYCSNDGSRLVELHAAPVAPEQLIGRTLDGRYRVDELVGAGGMATVYRGYQLSIDRGVILKVIHPSIARDPEVAARLLAVGRLSCQISSPSIANTFDFGQTEDGLVYFVMELVRGKTLADELAHRPLVARRAIGIAMQIVDALEAAEKHGLAHGCLAPKNVIVVDDSSRRDVVKVVDFGLAPPGAAAEDPRLARYRSPEQFAGQAVDQRADLYALGCILYECLAGTPPFSDTSIDILRNRVLSAQPPKLPPNVPGPLAAVVEKLLAKSPSHRYRFAADVKRALAPLHVADTTPLTALPTSRVVGKGEITAVSQPPGTPHPGTYPPGSPHPSTYPPGTPHPGTYPPYTTPHPGAAPASAPTTARGSRVVVIAIVAIVVSAIGVALLLAL